MDTIGAQTNKVAQNLAWRTAFHRFQGNLHKELITLKYAKITQQP